MPDWRNPQDYVFTHNLTAGQWAWEYLRRNPVYRQEWGEFMAIWRRLEAAYGKPSERDVEAWKRDPRAWVPAERCRESDCRVDGDKVLIECALGARWGFYKFPPDPTDDDPVGGGRLVWRDVPMALPLLEGGIPVPSGARHAVLAFDLGLPLAPQLEQAKRRLQIEQRRRVSSGDLQPPRIASHAATLARGLRLLDASAERISLQAQAAALGLSAEALNGVLSEALELRDGGYRHLLWWV